MAELSCGFCPVLSCLDEGFLKPLAEGRSKAPVSLSTSILVLLEDSLVGDSGRRERFSELISEEEEEEEEEN